MRGSPLPGQGHTQYLFKFFLFGQVLLWPFSKYKEGLLKEVEVVDYGQFSELVLLEWLCISPEIVATPVKTQKL